MEESFINLDLSIHQSSLVNYLNRRLENHFLRDKVLKKGAFSMHLERVLIERIAGFGSTIYSSFQLTLKSIKFGAGLRSRHPVNAYITVKTDLVSNPLKLISSKSKIESIKLHFSSYQKPGIRKSAALKLIQSALHLNKRILEKYWDQVLSQGFDRLTTFLPIAFRSQFRADDLKLPFEFKFIPLKAFFSGIWLNAEYFHTSLEIEGNFELNFDKSPGLSTSPEAVPFELQVKDVKASSSQLKPALFISYILIQELIKQKIKHFDIPVLRRMKVKDISINYENDMLHVILVLNGKVKLKIRITGILHLNIKKNMLKFRIHSYRFENKAVGLGWISKLFSNKLRLVLDNLLTFEFDKIESWTKSAIQELADHLKREKGIQLDIITKEISICSLLMEEEGIMLLPKFVASVSCHISKMEKLFAPATKTKI